MFCIVPVVDNATVLNVATASHSDSQNCPFPSQESRANIKDVLSNGSGQDQHLSEGSYGVHG